MKCWRCKSEMPEGLKYCGNCGVHMNRAVHVFQWLFSKKGLPVLIVVLALVIGAAAWYIIPKLRVPTIDFDLDMGWYTPSEDDIVYHDDSKTFGYVNNMILVFFTKDATDEEITEVIVSVDGEVVGILPGVRQYQIRVPARTEEELEALRKELMEFEVVKNAVIDYVATVEGETISAPNDPWEDYPGFGYSPSWDEASPGGTNWWIEATKVLSAWSYQDSFSHINVGIVDNGYDTTHEDLELVILNPEVSNSEDHGTHVAGIMGATADNGLGITGVLKDTTMYCVDCYATEAQSAQQISVSSLLAGIDMCIMNGSRVVNMSSGLKYEYASQYPEGVQQTARNAITYLIMMLDAYDEDFIIVQSAGNGDLENIGVDACRYNGYFASITPDMVQAELDRMVFDGVKLEKTITVDDVMNSLMVIGAVDIARVNGAYQLSDFSNYGSTITVCAPGVHILSTVPTGNGYEYFNGTSMAAPLAAGITAMVWSVDQEMSAAQVKDIIVSTALTEVRSRNSADHGVYYMINALEAVEKALEIADTPAETEPLETEAPTDPTEGTEPSEPSLDNPPLDRVRGYQNGVLYREDIFTLDGLGRIASVNTVIYNADGTVSMEETTRFTYDAKGRLTLADTPNNMLILAPTYRKFFYENDLLTRTESTEGDNYETVYTYDIHGKCVHSVTEWETSTETIQYFYDSDGLLETTLSTNVPEVAGLEVAEVSTVYAYDEFGRVIEMNRSYSYMDTMDRYRYDHSYPGFVVEENSTVSASTLLLNDSVGINIWALYLGPAPVFETNAEGWITGVSSGDQEFSFEFTYREETAYSADEQTIVDLLKRVETYRQEYITYTLDELFDLYSAQLASLVDMDRSSPGEQLDLGNVIIDSYKYSKNYGNAIDAYHIYVKYYDADHSLVYREEFYFYKDGSTLTDSNGRTYAPFELKVVSERQSEVFPVSYGGRIYDCTMPGRTGTEGHYLYWNEYELYDSEYLTVDGYEIVHSYVFDD